MHIYAQHGWGKKRRIETAIRDEHISGVVLSPRNEQPKRMSKFIKNLRDEFKNNVTILFDPQFYLTNLTSVDKKHLSEYPSCYESELIHRDFIAQPDIQKYVFATLKYQTNFDLDRLISPTILFKDFSDIWYHISLTIAQSSIEIYEQLNITLPLLISIVMDESALNNRKALEEFLDIITTLNASGYYIIINQKDTKYPAYLDQNALSNLIYLVYVLAEVNKFEVICGYTDFVGLLLLAVGSKAICTGWNQSLRQFSLDNFVPRDGGGKVRSRYTSAKLLNSILVNPELQSIWELGFIDDVLSNTSYDKNKFTKNPANVNWPIDISYPHHLEVLKRIATDLSSIRMLTHRIEFIKEKIQLALETYRYLQQKNVKFGTTTGPRNLHQWLYAIQNFQKEINRWK